MPNYKLLGIYSFANNLKEININDKVILKSEKFNIKSKNAIGVYTINDKKIGYLPIENHSLKSLNLNLYQRLKIRRLHLEIMMRMVQMT